MAKVTQETTSTTEQQPERTLTLGLHVDQAKDLPDTAYEVSEFITILTEQVGDFDIDLQVAVNTPATNEEGVEVIGFTADLEPFDFSEEDDDEYEDGDHTPEKDFDIDIEEAE